MMQTIIVIIIIVLAAVYLARRIYLRLSRPAQTGCGCGCGGCAAQCECSLPQKSRDHSSKTDPA